MRKKQGFTLVELLVVMAIIAILASIVVPNAIKYITRSRATKAQSEIASIELALTAMLSDAGRSDINHLFDPMKVREFIGLDTADLGAEMTKLAFEAAQKLYTVTLYALLREGRVALTDDYTIRLSNGDSRPVNFGDVLNNNVIRKLGTSYLEDLGVDPWGNMYQIFPGPWRTKRVDGRLVSPVPFRMYMNIENSDLPGSKGAAGHPDGYELITYDPDTEEQLTVGFPASRNKSFFIYSLGQNMVSGQMIYNPNGYEGLDDGSGFANYDPNQDEAFLGGGDDINNWDKGASWMRFYN